MPCPVGPVPRVVGSAGAQGHVRVKIEQTQALTQLVRDEWRKMELGWKAEFMFPRM